MSHIFIFASLDSIFRTTYLPLELFKNSNTNHRTVLITSKGLIKYTESSINS